MGVRFSSAPASLVLVGLFLACDGDGNESGTGTTSTGAPLTQEEAREAAEAMLRAMEGDLPTGWTQRPLDEDVATPPTRFEGECNDLFPDPGEEPGEIVHLESESFDSPDGRIQIEFSAEIFEDETDAAQSFVNARRLVGECREQVEAAWLEFVRKDIESREATPGALPGVLEATGLQLSEVPFSDFGDEATLLRLSTFFTLDGEEHVSYVDLVGVRVANVIGGFSAVTGFEPPPDMALAEELAGGIEGHAAQTAGSLR